MNVDRLKLGSSNWKQQFIDALNPGGGDDDEDGGEKDEDEKPSCMDWFMHFVALPWKLFFATCPPVDFLGGYLCFFWSLAYVGLTTAVIGDLASLFGCTVGLLDSVTAITFVALGTSLPDTFASMAAATGDPYADAAIGTFTFFFVYYISNFKYIFKFSNHSCSFSFLYLVSLFKQVTLLDQTLSMCFLVLAHLG
jgi:solute carrier family 8 (sodium/calcium exchanger)